MTAKKLLNIAENSNPFLWNCQYSIVSCGPDIELDQFFGKELYQVGEGNITTQGFNFHGSLN